MPENQPRKLSVCMIVKNEANLLGRCLESVSKAADEIVVVDTGSNDNTIDIARKFGAKVIEIQWRNDFAWARNISLDNAGGDWILWIDADDVVPLESIAQINALKQEKPDKVFSMIVRNEKPGNIGSEFMQARMFPNNPSIRFERRIHEQMMPSALRLGMKLVNKPVVIEHHGYADPDTLKKKAQRNVSLLTADYNHTCPDAVSAVEIGDSYSIIGDWEQAINWYNHILSIPNSDKATPVIVSQAHLGLGSAYNKKENYPKAIIHFTESLRFCPDRPDALYGLAVALDLDNRKKDAINALLRIIGSSGKNTLQVSIDFRQCSIKAFIRIASILAEEQRLDELAGIVDKAVGIYGERPEIQNMAGAAWYRLKRIMDALHAFEKSLQITINGNIDAYIGLCVIYRAVGREDTVRTTLESIRELFLNTPRFWAFCRITGYVPGTLPVSVTNAAIEEENLYLCRLYGLK